MNTRAYSPLDFEDVHSWYAARGKDISADMLPTVGLVVPGVAAGFLYQTDASICFIEGIVTNPAAKLCERVKAVSLIIDEIVALARNIGFRHVVGFGNQGTIRLTLRKGFRHGGAYEMVTKEVV